MKCLSGSKDCTLQLISFKAGILQFWSLLQMALNISAWFSIHALELPLTI